MTREKQRFPWWFRYLTPSIVMAWPILAALVALVVALVLALIAWLNG